MFSFYDALDEIADGAKHKVVVFEYNAGNHAQKRALANALATHAIERDGRLPVVCSANCLQPDGQNDNGWNQGLLFLNPSNVWLQPPGYVTKMLSRNYQPVAVPVEVTGKSVDIDVSAKRSEDGRTLVVQIVNCGGEPRSVRLHVDGFKPARSSALVEELASGLDDCNTAAEPLKVCPKQSEWHHEWKDGEAVYPVPANSFTILRFK